MHAQSPTSAPGGATTAASDPIALGLYLPEASAEAPELPPEVAL